MVLINPDQCNTALLQHGSKLVSWLDGLVLVTDDEVEPLQVYCSWHMARSLISPSVGACPLAVGASVEIK